MRLARVANGAGLGALGLWVLLFVISRLEPASPGVLVAYAPPVAVAVPPLVIATLALAVRAWRGMLAALLAGLFATFAWGRPALPVPRADAGDGRPLVVATYNVDKWLHGVPAVAGAIRGFDADVVCLAEAGAYDWQTFDGPARLGQSLEGYRVVGEGELRIATRLPILGTRALSLAPGPASRPLVEAVVEWRGRPVRIYAAHFVPTLLGSRWDESRGEAAGGDLAAIARVRLAQADRARDALVAGQGPAVLCGDLNAPPASAPIRRLAEVATDAWTAGAGFGLTSPAPNAYVRLDYVFARGLAPARAEVAEVLASDHFAVVARLR